MKDRENGSLPVGNPHRSKLAVVAVLGLLALLLWSRFGEGERLAEVDEGRGETSPLLVRQKEPLREPPTVGLFSDGVAPLEQEPLAAITADSLTALSTVKKEAWREPLDLLIAAGRAQEDPAAAIAALLTAQPGMGDQLLTLLLETEGGQDEQDALMVALATALSIGKKIGDGEADHLQQEGAAGGDWASLWFDRGGTILAMADLWISGEQRARYFPRFLQVEGVMQPWHAIELASMMESTEGPLPLAEESRTRLLKMIEMSLATADDEAVAVAGEWLQSPIPELRRVAQKSVVSALVDDPAGAANWIGQAEESLQVPLLEAVLHRISGEHLPDFLEHAADLMVQQEYHGSALMSGFSRATDLDLQQMIYQRGDSIDSEGYRNLVLYGSQGGIGRGGSISPGWARSLKRVAQTDPSRSVRGTALRICAMSWPIGDAAGFQRLIETSDVDQRTAEIAASLLNARGVARWSSGD
jgi:hypothetical protein